MKKTLLTIVSIFALGSAYAQISISPVGGIDVIGYSVKLGGGSYITNLQAGPCAGVLADIPLKGILSPQVGLLYRMYFNNASTVAQTYGGPKPLEDHHFVSGMLDIPLKLVYSFQPHNGNRFFVGAGPYVSFNVLATDHIHGHYYDVAGNEIESYDRKEDFRSGRADIGGGISGGFRAAKGWLISVQGQYSISNHYPQEHYYNFGIVGGYTFKLKKQAHTEAQSK